MTDFQPNKRQDSILDMIRESGFVSTDAMVEAFNVTPQTIRRDLNELSEHRLLERFHGGAGQPKQLANTPYKTRQSTQYEAKRQIAEATAALIPDGSSLFLNIGTTTEAIATALLQHKNLHVVTNNVHVAVILGQNETFNIMLAGGQFRASDGGVVGIDSVDFIKKFRLDIGIIGVSGIDNKGNLLDFDRLEVSTAQGVIENSSRVILVADHDKFGRRAMNKIGVLNDIDTLVTDKDLHKTYRALCNQMKVQVITAEK